MQIVNFFEVFAKTLDKAFHLIYNIIRDVKRLDFTYFFGKGLGADMEMAKNLQMGVLLDIYGALLTERQREMMDLYYNDDLSLSEIAEQYEISRQGVHDALKRSEETLRHYDNALGLAAAQQQQKNQLLEFKSQALAALEECRKVTFGKNIAEKVIALLENLDSKLEEYENSDYNE